MPEGPELHLSSRFINSVCKGRVFGKIQKSDISKNPVVEPPAQSYIISASSRGKEIKLTLTECADNISQSTDPAKSLDILFTFGLAGKFDFHEASELQKHAHLNFFTSDPGQKMVLSFVDYMRFGKWTPGADFSYKDRGPCVLLDYEKFRANVLDNVSASAFNKPICEVLLNQKYFNGIGNYLRAEILYRAKIPPFVSARSVLEPLTDKEGAVKADPGGPDILQLCNILSREVVELESSWYDGGDRSDEDNGFNAWLQCYYQDGMKNTVDHNKRTIWYSGPLGPMAPKEGIVRGKKKSKSKKKSSGSPAEQDEFKEEVTSKRKLQAEETVDTESGILKPKQPKRGRSAKASSVPTEKTEETLPDNIKPIRKTRGGNSKTAEYNLKHSETDTAQMASGCDVSKEENLKSGRPRRGQLKQTAEIIDEKPIKTQRQRKNDKDKKTAVEEKLLTTSEIGKGKKGTSLKRKIRQKDEMIDDFVKSEPISFDVKQDVEIKQEHAEILHASEPLQKSEQISEPAKISTRTKSRARSGKPLQHYAPYLTSARVMKRKNLKTPLKSTKRRLSNS